MNKSIETYLDIIRDLYEDKLPFNKLLGLEVKRLTTEEAGFSFHMKNDLVGNYVHGILHGGVISAVLDATGGLTASASALHKAEEIDPEVFSKRLAKVSTIDLRVDYLRPGKGETFHTKGTVMRSGRKVAVIRMELRNQDDLLIAVGTGAYIVG